MRAKKFVAILFILFISITQITMLAGCNSDKNPYNEDSNEKHYEEGKTLFNSGKYEEAATAFETLGDYKDATELAGLARKSIMFGEWFKDVSWDGDSVIFTVINEVSLGLMVKASAQNKSVLGLEDFEFGGVSIFAEENELEVNIIPSSYSMPLAKMGSAYVVAAGETIRCELENAGTMPTRIVVTLEDGTVLEKPLQMTG